MGDRFLGVLAATASAPCLTLFFLSTFSGTHSAWEVLIELPLAALIGGMIGLFFYGIPLFAVASFLASLAHYWNCESLLNAIIAGGFVGLCAAILFGFLVFEIHTSWRLYLAFVTSGFVSGWIYWRIAIRQTPDSTRPITTS